MRTYVCFENRKMQKIGDWRLEVCQGETKGDDSYFISAFPTRRLGRCFELSPDRIGRPTKWSAGKRDSQGGDRPTPLYPLMYHRDWYASEGKIIR